MPCLKYEDSYTIKSTVICSIILYKIILYDEKRKSIVPFTLLIENNYVYHFLKHKPNLIRIFK